MGTLAGHERSHRGRLRGAGGRSGTWLVLAVTVAVVLGASYLADRGTGGTPVGGGTTGGTTAITLSGTSAGAAPVVGRPAPEFTATGVDGTPVVLSSYRGKVVWLTFGATWCAACRAEAPDIEAAYRKARADGVVVVAVFISEDAGTVRGYAERAGLTFPQVADPDTRIASAYRVNGVPAHFFIDRSGVVRSIRSGGLSTDRMSEALAEVRR